MRRLLRATDDGGTTLAEVLVAVVLLGVLGSIITAAVLNTSKTLRITDDEAQGLSDVRTAGERLARDVRAARGVTVGTDPATTATASQLSMWIDSNSDYVQQPSETVTWKLAGPTSGQFNLVRAVSGGATVTQARTIVSNLAFQYCTSPGTCTAAPATAAGLKLVSVSITYNAVANGGISDKLITFQARMRNVT